MSNVLHKLDGAVGIVTLAKPPHNLIDDDFCREIVTAYRTVLAAGCRAILLRSAMRHFCAGAEVQSFDRTSFIHKDQHLLLDLMQTLEDAPVPTVAAVHGAVLGGGLELALTCDMMLSADTATLGQVEPTVGLLPLLGGTQRVAERVGSTRAKEITMLGRRYPPEAFERWGIINLVVPEDDLAEVSLTWARQLACGPTKVLAGIKKQANLAARYGVAAVDAKQIEINEEIWQAKDRLRGAEAFFKTGPATAVFEGD